MHLMAARRERLHREAPITWLQQGLNYVGVEGESWESNNHHKRGRGLVLDPTTCVLHMAGQQPVTHVLMTSTAEGLPIWGELRY